MLRTIPIWALLVCSVVIVADAKPFIVKVFAPVGYSSVQTTATVAPVNTQFISSLIASKINLLDSILRAKSSFGGFGIRKEITFLGGATTTTTERPVTYPTTEVNTDFIPEVSSSTQSVYTTTTTDGDIATPKPTVHPVYPIKTSTPLIPTKSTTTESTLETTTTTGRTTNGYTYEPSVSTTQGYTYQPPIPTSTPYGYSYQTPTPSPYYLPASNLI